MNDNQKQKPRGQKQIKHTNVLESLKDVGGSTAKSLKKDVLQGASQEFLNQLFARKYGKVRSGEISPGETLEFDEVLSGQHEETLKLKKQIALERKLREEEKVRIEKKSNELRLQLNAIIQEVSLLSQTTQELTQETQIAAMQAPIEPGIYHVIFFEKLLEFIKSFRKKIEESKIWLHASNNRAQKKNYWARYKKHGGKFLLAADHYVSRSAG